MLATILLYLAGHATLAVGLVLVNRFVRALRREPALLPRRQAVFELIAKSARIEAAEAEIAHSAAELKILEGKIERAVTESRNHLSLDDAGSVTLGFFLLAVILAEVEAGVVWLLSGAAQFLGLSPEVWAFAAPPVAAATILGLHVLIGLVVNDKQRPARAIRHAKIGTAICGFGALIGFWLILSGRTLSEAPTIEKLAGLGLTILTVLLSLAAAFCTQVVTILWDAQHPERNLLQLQRRRNDYLRHIEQIERDLSRIRVEQPEEWAPPSVTADKSAQQQSTPHVITPRNIAPGGLVLVLALGLPLTGRAQSSAPTAFSRTVGITLARAGNCEFLVDMTSSLDQGGLRGALITVNREMPGIVNGFRCAVVRIVPFADSIFDQIDEIAMPAADVDKNCETNAKPRETQGGVKPAEMIFPVVKAANRQKIKDACAAKREEERRAALSQVSEHLLALADQKRHGPCTALSQAIQRALIRSQHVIAITDGIATCAPPPRTAPVPADGNLLFLIVPTTDPRGIKDANALVERLTTLERVFQGSRALLAPEATHAFWQLVGGSNSSSH